MSSVERWLQLDFGVSSVERWRIVWRTDRYADGWFYAINDALGQQTFDHIYVKHRGYKYAISDITKARTTPIQEQAQ